MMRRRDFLVHTSAALGIGVSRSVDAQLAGGTRRRKLLTRVIPSSGQRIPVIGMGTSGSFEVGEDEAARVRLREVLRRFVAAGASVVDTAPTYTTADDVLGELVAGLATGRGSFSRPSSPVSSDGTQGSPSSPPRCSG